MKRRFSTLISYDLTVRPKGVSSASLTNQKIIQLAYLLQTWIMDEFLRFGAEFGKFDF